MHRFLVLLASLLAISLALQCYDAGDKLINQRCFKLVNQKLSFADARNWCHYHNPVSPSYLAVVTDQTTTTFLASYARTSFNVNEGPFWIGLSRANSTSKFYWDNEQQLVWSNFELQTAQNYVAESVSNGKWTTYSGDTKMNFVCSYDPNAPPTFSPSTGSTPPMTDATETIDSSTPYTAAGGTTGWSDVTPTPTDSSANCTPSTPSTFLFAYSNDFEPQVISNALYSIISYLKITSKYVKFANIRFDSVPADNISYHDTIQSFNESVLSNLPNSSVKFPDDSGSNAQSYIASFLRNTQAPICGSRIMRLMKRYLTTDPNAIDLYHDLQSKHVLLWTIYSTSITGIGTHSTVLGYWVNGFDVFSDDVIYSTVATSASAIAYYNNILYAKDSYVRGRGSIEFPQMETPSTSDNKKVHVYYVICFQSTGDFDNLLSVDFHLNGGSMSFTKSFNVTGIGYHKSAAFGIVDLLPATVYNVSVDYDYDTELEQNLDIRMYTDNPIAFWLSY